MELKYYGKPWLQAFKGAYFILLGILLMLKIPGSIQSIAIIFSFFIGLTGFVLITATILLRKKEYRIWNFVLGILNLLFALLIILKLDETRLYIFWIIVSWVLFNAATELFEAGILIVKKNAFFSLFIISALLSSLLGMSMFNLIVNFTDERLFNVGFVALVFGLVYLLSAYTLASIKDES